MIEIERKATKTALNQERGCDLLSVSGMDVESLILASDQLFHFNQYLIDVLSHANYCSTLVGQIIPVNESQAYPASFGEGGAVPQGRVSWQICVCYQFIGKNRTIACPSHGVSPEADKELKSGLS